MIVEKLISRLSWRQCRLPRKSFQHNPPSGFDRIAECLDHRRENRHHRISPVTPSITSMVWPAKSTNRRSPARCTWRSVGFRRMNTLHRHADTFVQTVHTASHYACSEVGHTFAPAVYRFFSARDQEREGPGRRNAARRQTRRIMPITMAAQSRVRGFPTVSPKAVLF